MIGFVETNRETSGTVEIADGTVVDVISVSEAAQYRNDTTFLICSSYVKEMERELARIGAVHVYNCQWMHQVYSYAADVHVRRFIERYQPQGGVALDVGANIGVFSSMMHQRAAQIIAFEPNPRVVPHLRRNLEGYANIQLYEVGVGARPGRASFHLDLLTEFGTSSTLQPQEDGVYWQSHEVDIVTLDDVMRNQAGPVRFIKIDAEGVDIDVLEGAREIILTDKPAFVIEASANDLAARSDMMSFLDQHYSLIRLEDNTPLRNLIPAPDLNSFLDQIFEVRTQNIGAIPR